MPPGPGEGVGKLFMSLGRAGKDDLLGLKAIERI